MAFFLQLHFMLIFTSLLRLILSFIFLWYFPEKSENICLFFRHVSVNIHWILFVIIFLIELSFWTIQFVFVYLFGSLYSFVYSNIDIHLFIRILIGLVPCLTFLSCLAIHIFSFTYSLLFVYLFVISLSYFFIILSYLFELFSIFTYLFHVLCSC